MVQVLLATHQYGEAIARCQKAVSWLSLITHVPSSTWKTLHQTITTQLNQTQKENDLIYLQPVPTTFPSIPSSFLSLTPLPFIYPSTSSSTFLPSLFLTSLPTYLASCIYHVTQRVTQAMTYLATLQASPTFLEKLSTFTGYTTYETQWTEVDQRKEHVQRQLHQLLATSTSLNDPVTSHLLPWIQEVQLKHTVVSKNLPLLLEQLQAKQPVAKWLENMQDVLHRLDSLPSHCDHQTLECITLVTHQASVTQMTHFFNQVVHPCFSTPYFLHFDVPKLLVELNEFQELQNKFTRSHEFYLTLMKTLDGYTPLTPDAVQPSTPNTQPLLTPSTSTTPESVFQLGQWNANQQPLHFKKGGKGLE
ncbi:hypothetical protein HMI55_003349 [Coelomomyces lativittatus]|nr:hypothetical protein HMI55_003349 [Coelomomyces lativittatus]